jgi:hypothetical protein
MLDGVDPDDREQAQELLTRLYAVTADLLDKGVSEEAIKEQVQVAIDGQIG